MSVSGYILIALGFYAVSRAVVRHEIRHSYKTSEHEDSPFVIKVDRPNHREEKN